MPRSRDPGIQLIENPAYSEAHHPRGSLPTPPGTVYHHADSNDQEKVHVYEIIPGEDEPPLQDNTQN